MCAKERKHEDKTQTKAVVITLAAIQMDAKHLSLQTLGAFWKVAPSTCQLTTLILNCMWKWPWGAILAPLPSAFDAQELSSLQLDLFSAFPRFCLQVKHQKARWSNIQCDQITLHYTRKATNACLHLPMLKKDGPQNVGLRGLQLRPPRQYPAAFLFAVYALKKRIKEKKRMLIFLSSYGSHSRLQSRVTL